MIHRDLYEQISNYLEVNKVLMIFGARRVGKSVLLQQIIEAYEKPYILLNGEDLDDADRLSSRRRSMYDAWLKGIRLLIIDEAHAIEDIGIILKLIIDSYPELTIIATGSSAFDLNKTSGEPLVGRRIVFEMYPFTEQEIINSGNAVEAERSLQTRLIFGSYPEVHLIENLDEKAKYLKDLVASYLLKDILAYENVRHSNKLLGLLKLIAYQVGSEVSYEELANTLKIDRNTVEKYLDLLSKVFVLFKVGGYSGNLRKEISKSSKWYFNDIGLRNAIIGDFRPMEIRQDRGQVWENFFIAERRKFTKYCQHNFAYYFWRTYDQQEIDLLEVDGKQLKAFEIKTKVKKNYKFPIAFRKTYLDAQMELITQQNYQTFLRNDL